MTQKLVGGCHCKAIRYEVNQVIETGYCHCSICRKLSGAPALAWALATKENFQLLTGNPTEYASSELATRSFCPVCGSQVFGLIGVLEIFWINLGTLDKPELVKPQTHICAADQVSWFSLDDSLPRYESNVTPKLEKLIQKAGLG